MIVTSSVCCDLCGKTLGAMTLHQGNHMCPNGFLQVSAGLQTSGAECGLLLDGLAHLTPAQKLHFDQFLQSKQLFFHIHGDSTLLMHLDTTNRDSLLRILYSFSLRLVVLGHTHGWRCLHVKLIPAATYLPFGHAETQLVQVPARLLRASYCVLTLCVAHM